MSAQEEREAVARQTAEELARTIRVKADKLRHLGAELDALAERALAGPASYANIAASVQHTVLWALPNIGLDGLVIYAYDADRYAREAREGEQSGEVTA
jgi:hypothetical protein